MLLCAAFLLLTAGWMPESQTAAGLLGTQYSDEQQISAGHLLVASEKLGDPNFAESVVLVLEHDADKGTLGVIINRRTEVPLSRVFPEVKSASSDPVYVGGPVSITAVQALLRLPNEIEDVSHISGDIYATGSKQVIENSVRTRVSSSKFRLYVGYAGWAPGQLEAEVQVGAWLVLANRSKLIFDNDPDSLWSRLIHESHMQIADSRSPRRPLWQAGSSFARHASR
jgi:putative transcriptional regulator